MRLLVFSDLHNDTAALAKLMDAEADAYIAAGDSVSWAKGFDRIGELLARRAGKVWVLPGNHESEADIARLCRAWDLNELHGRTFEAAGFTIAGLGYSNPTPFNTPGEYAESEMARRLEAFAGLKPLVLVCHCAPKLTPLDRVREGVHIGSTAVREFLDRHAPAHFVCGHVHEAEGVVCDLGPTRAANAGKRGYLLQL
ncbi:MAG: metallophosphoesterase [Acidobacteria bacterium]|nr:metallophosphoesterase [Acidobacteriota bacterium]